MGSEAPALLVDKVNVAVDAPVGRSCPGKENWRKAPKRAHKSEREKLKREHLNELFLQLADSLEPTQQNNGKASILCEATRLLKDLISQIEGLKKENAALLSESHYMTLEKNELREEKCALETDIKKLQNELESRVAHSKPDLNIPPPELTTHFPGDGLRLPAIEPALQQTPTVFVVPIHQAYAGPDTAQLSVANVSKPHARYPTPTDSWPTQLLGEQPTARNDLQLSGQCSPLEQNPDDMIHSKKG